MEWGNIPSFTYSIINDPNVPSRLPPGLAVPYSAVAWQGWMSYSCTGDWGNRGKLSVDQSIWSSSSAPTP